MKTYLYTERISIDDLHLVDRPDPLPGPNDVVLKMRAAALNHRDLAMLRGHYHVGAKAPLVPLSDGAGEVISRGSKVTRLSIGDLACPLYLPDWIDGPLTARSGRRRLGGPSDGVLSEMLCIHEQEAVRAPSHLQAGEAATLPTTAVTAWQSLHRVGSLRPGDTVLIQGTGGVSTAALQFARAAGARVIALTRRENHRAKLVDLGANDVVVGGDSPDWPERVMALTGGIGVDVALDVAGGASLNRSIASTRIGGHVHLIGFSSGTSAEIDIFEAIRHGTTIHVATAGNRRSFEELVRAMELHTLRPAISRRFKVTEIREALKCLEEGGQFGKIVLEF